ncbi:MAG: hypothetical protein LIP23_08855 [Planctomycetes bacterium]|nr:hypothetical protein [Planctomycetota bacterium]
MMTKAELLRRFQDIILTEGYTMPLYLGHLLQTLPWYGLPAELERTTKRVLEKIRLETEESRRATERLYIAIQEAKHGEF